MNASFCRANALCEEFSDYVIYDSELDSVLVNVPFRHFEIIYLELGKLGYTLVFKTQIEKTNSLTCTFIKE
tara:strand:- start:404 stop:616 length:213 start_codon:yes stop_codon:yes gene_type:complete